MTPDTVEPTRASGNWFQKLGANLFLGFLVTVLSVFTAFTNYSTYQVSGTASDHEKEGSRLLADSNTEYINATMYADSTDLFNQAFEEFDLASAASEKEAAYQLAMLIAAVGLAFAAYASLLDEKNRLRPLFALLSLFMLVLSGWQYLVA